MQSRLRPTLKPALRALLLLGLTMDSAFAAVGNCSALPRLPSVIEIGEGFQQDMQSPVAITRLAVGDPKIADVHANGGSSFLLTGVGPGATSLMVWTACSAQPQQAMVFVQGAATTALTSSVPSDDPTLPSQVQTDIRFVEVSRTKLKEATASLIGTRGKFPVRFARHAATNRRRAAAAPAGG